MKIQITLLTVMLTLALSYASAMENPMMQVAQVNPIPMFMPILVKKSAELSLTQVQIEAFAKWRGENMASALQASNAITNGEIAIKQASLDSKSRKEIDAMLVDVAKARADLANRTLRCHARTKEILTADQWQKLLNIYAMKNVSNK